MADKVPVLESSESPLYIERAFVLWAVHRNWLPDTIPKELLRLIAQYFCVMRMWVYCINLRVRWWVAVAPSSLLTLFPVCGVFVCDLTHTRDSSPLAKQE